MKGLVEYRLTKDLVDKVEKVLKEAKAPIAKYVKETEVVKRKYWFDKKVTKGVLKRTEGVHSWLFQLYTEYFSLSLTPCLTYYGNDLYSSLEDLVKLSKVEYQVYITQTHLEAIEKVLEVTGE